MGDSQVPGGRLVAEASALIRGALALPLNDANRPIRLRLPAPGPGERALPLDGLLLVQRIEIDEGLFTGLTARITCLSAVAALPLEAFLGLPVEVQLVTDRGSLRRFCCIVVEARAGQSDGGLAVFQLTGRDALGVMEQRVNSRVFRQQSVAAISRTVMREWLQRSPGLAGVFDFDLSGLSLQRYPEREFTMQHNESDAAFLRRLWRRAGIGWRVCPGDTAAEMPLHRLVLFDDAMLLPANAAGALRFHRDAATEARDAITQWAPVRRLVPGRSSRQSWDYRLPRMLGAEEASILDQGASGNALAAALHDSTIEAPHAADDAADHRRLTRLRMLRHELEGSTVHGLSGVRDLAAGEWNSVSGHGTLDMLPPAQREFVITEVRHWGENNLPKQLDERAQGLLAGSALLPGWFAGTQRAGSEPRRYANRFTAVRRGLPLLPAWDPREHLPPMAPMTALVVGPPEQEVHCDALGRVKVQFQGLSVPDHEHAQGAGSSGSERDSAWIRVSSGWAGAGFGSIQPLRVGMEVRIDFLGGDPDRPVIAGVLYNAHHPPPRFSRVGSLPGNRYLSGTTTQEVKGNRGNQLRFDDTPGEISAQLASQHGQSQLNLGYLTHPREGGAGEARGEGLELRTDAAAAIRAARGLLLSTDGRADGSGRQLDRNELMACLDAARELATTLFDAADRARAQTRDPVPQRALQTAVDELESGSIERPVEGGGRPVIAIAGAAGIALSTPASTTVYTGENLDIIANANLQQTVGRRWVSATGGSISWFAAGQHMPAGQTDSINLIAARGDLLAEAQDGKLNLRSEQDAQLASNAQVSIDARGGIVLTEQGGAQIELSDGNVDIRCPGKFTVHAASFSHVAPAGGSPRLPSMPDDSRLQDWIGLAYLDLETGDPVDGATYEVRYTNGVTVRGTLDQNGRARHDTVPDSTVDEVTYGPRTPKDDDPHPTLESALR